jgi:cell shape-determining protein MreC
MRFEKKTERFFLMLISLIIATLIIDLANLTYEIKFALSLGFAIGIGALVGVFSAWAFFGEYLERRMSSTSESSVEDA